MLGPTVGAAGTPTGRGANMAFWTATRRRTRCGASSWKEEDEEDEEE